MCRCAAKNYANSSSPTYLHTHTLDCGCERKLCVLNRTSPVVVGGRGDAAKWTEGACYELASVSEHETNVIKSLTTCTSSATSSSSSSASAASATTGGGGGAINREQHLYQSTTHSVELRLAAGSPAHRRLGRFLIRYEGNLIDVMPMTHAPETGTENPYLYRFSACVSCESVSIFFRYRNLIRSRTEQCSTRCRKP